MGWRYLTFTIGGITLGVFLLRFVVFHFEESPKYLVSRGKDAKAIEVLHRIAKFNKQECTLTLEAFEELANERDSAEDESALIGGGARQLNAPLSKQIKAGLARYALLFNSFAMARLTVLVWLTYICDFWG